MTRVGMVAMLAVAVAGCAQDEPLSPPPKSGLQAYLLFNPPNEQQGWAAIFAMRDKLHTSDAKRIRTTGLISSRMTTMYVDADASCTRDGAFVRDVQKIARDHGIDRVTCSETLPEPR